GFHRRIAEINQRLIFNHSASEVNLRYFKPGVLLCTPLTKTALTDMALRRCHRLCNVIGIAKYVFLTCVSLITCGVIVGGILAYLIILPYYREARFEQTSCVYLGEEMKRIIDCESKCAKDRSSYPCYMVRVNISGVPEQGVLFENFLTYLEQDKTNCSSAPCLPEAVENVEMTQRYIKTLRRRRNFTCYFRGPDSRQKNSVLLTKIYTKEQAKHCAIWPAFAVSIGAIVLIGTHYCAGCTVWTQDKTVIA
ncbi:hypothetical protein BOX15_Mlig013936g3, partial [Macrostomum lignano]